MNLFQLVFKQMRQRSLSTALTLLSVLLGVSLAVSILILRREARNAFAQTDFGYDIIIGPPKGSPLQLTLNTVYHMDTSPGNVPYSLYEDMARKGPPPPKHPDYRPAVRMAIPFMVGDSYHGRRIVGTSPLMFGFNDDGSPSMGTDSEGHAVSRAFEYRRGRSYEFAEGRVFAAKKFEAVVGSEVAEQLHMKLYDSNLTEKQNQEQGRAFQATHGMPGPNVKPDIHKPVWHVVGILKQTHTANDRVLFVPIVSLYAIEEHEIGMIEQRLLKLGYDPMRIPPERLDEVLAKLGIDPRSVPDSVKKKFKMKRASTQPTTRSTQDVGELLKDATLPPAKEEKKEEEGEDPDAYHLDDKGDIVPDVPPEEWELSAILVQSRGPFQAQQLMYTFKVIDPQATAVNPATVMREFFDTFLSGSTLILLLIAALVSVVAAVGILVSIYNSVAARNREIAILRALGATRGKVVTLICVEAGMIGLLGGILGLLVGHGIGGVASHFMEIYLGQGINWLVSDTTEWLYLVAVVLIALGAGLVPAFKAYRTPVATNLVAQ